MEFDPLQNAPEWIRKQFLDIRHENERFGALRNLFPCTQPCRLGINRSISGHWILPEIAQKHIRIKYCQTWFRFCIIRRNSIMLAAFRGRSWEPIKRSGHSALSESALSECWLYAAPKVINTMAKMIPVWITFECSTFSWVIVGTKAYR